MKQQHEILDPKRKNSDIRNQKNNDYSSAKPGHSKNLDFLTIQEKLPRPVNNNLEAPSDNKRLKTDSLMSKLKIN